MIYLKQYGSQRSGTNLVKGLLEINFPQVRVLNLILGDKHSRIDPGWEPPGGLPPNLDLGPAELQRIVEMFRARRIGAIVVIKAPLAWLKSFHAYRQIKDKVPSVFDTAFVRRHLPTWIERNAHWIEDLDNYFAPTAIVRYDDLLSDARGMLDLLAARFSLGPIPATPTLSLPFATKRSTDADRGETVLTKRPFDPATYLEGRYLSTLTGEMREVAAAMLARHPMLAPFSDHTAARNPTS